jgi:hypothetical protein
MTLSRNARVGAPKCRVLGTLNKYNQSYDMNKRSITRRVRAQGHRLSERGGDQDQKLSTRARSGATGVPALAKT